MRTSLLAVFNHAAKLLACCWLAVALLPANASAAVSDYSWAQVCAGKVSPSSWYGSAEAQAIADTVIAVQKNNGGWMKNDELHRLSSADYTRLVSEKGTHSCLDNYATTQEMRYLAKVWKQTGKASCQTAFVRALQMIFTAQKGCGGWSQYLPLTGNGSYQDYITFNDDLMANVMRLLRDIYENQGDFENIVDVATRTRCQTAFNRGLQCILDCQVDDNGTLAAWCAQHDTVAPYLPTEGRPHELPSISGYESASLLSFLMTIDHPSEELKYRITAAVAWLDAHKIPDKAVEDYTNGHGQRDRHIVDQPGTNLWGRFIQIGGQSGTTIYNKLFNKLKKRNKTRSYTYNGVTYTFTEEQNARESYDPNRAYLPIFAIYKDTIQQMYYRFLYNYEDTPMSTNASGCPIYTSLMQTNRVSYQYVGSWCQRVIETEFPAWQARYQHHEAGQYTLSAQTCLATATDQTYRFNNSLSMTNNGGKTFATGQQSTIKYSANVRYTIAIPYDLEVTSAEVRGYNNYSDADANIGEWNGATFGPNDYLFPAKEDGDPRWVTYYMNMSDAPARDTLSFMVTGRQTCLVIQLNCASTTPTENIVEDANNRQKVVKFFRDGQVYIRRGERTYNTLGQLIH